MAVSAVLAMVAENRSVNAVLQELLKADGNGPRADAVPPGLPNRLSH